MEPSPRPPAYTVAGALLPLLAIARVAFVMSAPARLGDTLGYGKLLESIAVLAIGLLGGTILSWHALARRERWRRVAIGALLFNLLFLPGVFLFFQFH